MVSWNSIIAAYEQNDDPDTALGFFRRMTTIDAYNMMVECRTIIPNQGTWVSILPPYSQIGVFQQKNMLGIKM